ncbi:MAG: enoyl-CoA hydratase-related protein [Candidatus Bathyarchaeota archaeon]|jgi:enoyl-CoA hydratase/3-hydroxyacyl-CoA dehydrogenase
MPKKSRFSTIQVEKEGVLLWITFNRPGRMNAFNLDMVGELNTVIEEVDADDEVRCVLVKGEGERAFSVGADLTMFTGLDSERAIATSEKGQRLMDRIEASPKPFVAAIHGFCLGGGLEFALACDFRVVAESAQMGSPEINLGIIPGWGGTQRLCRFVGLPKAKELVFLGDRVSAKEALEIGLAHKVVPPDKLYEEAEALAHRLAEGPPVALKVAKRAMNEGSQLTLAEGLKMEAKSFGTLAATEDIVEGISAFFEKRKPEFKGK